MDACEEMSVSPDCIRRQFTGTEMQTTEEPGFAAPGDDPSALDNTKVAAAELDRFTGVG